MNLPKIEHPLTQIEIPSLKKKYPFRPFLVKEEKLLLMAKESENEYDIFIALKQVVTNCSLDESLKIDKLAIFDLEYLFIKLRAFSVDNKINVGYRDNEDNKIYNFDVNLDNIKIIYPEKIDNNIKITENAGLIMKYPSASLYSDKEFLKLEEEHLFELIIKCIDKIYDGEEIYEAKDFSKQQLSDFLENLSVKIFEDVQRFLSTSPKMEYVIDYENDFGNKRKIVLSSLNDFFTWR